MSFPVIERTFAHTTQRGSYLAALFFLADRADDDGVSWYGVTRIAQAINLSDRQTRHILCTLRECGEIWYRPRFRADGGQTSNCYVVCCGLSLVVIQEVLRRHEQFNLSPGEAAAAVAEIAAARGEPMADDGRRAAADGPAPAGHVVEPSAENADLAPAVAAWAEPADDEQVAPAVTSAMEGRDGRCNPRALPGACRGVTARELGPACPGVGIDPGR